jgi:hypothetical protein
MGYHHNLLCDCEASQNPANIGMCSCHTGILDEYYTQSRSVLGTSVVYAFRGRGPLRRRPWSYGPRSPEGIDNPCSSHPQHRGTRYGRQMNIQVYNTYHLQVPYTTNQNPNSLPPVPGRVSDSPGRSRYISNRRRSRRPHLTSSPCSGFPRRVNPYPIPSNNHAQSR